MERDSSCLPSKSLIDLDDDTIFYIIKFLTLQDQLALIASNTRFTVPFQSYAKAYLKDVDLLPHGYSLWHGGCPLDPLGVELFFEIAGETIESLSIPRNFTEEMCKKGFGLVGSKCVNLKSLKIANEDASFMDTLTRSELNAIFSNKLKLKTINFRNLDLDGLFLNAINHLPELTCLSFQNCRGVNDGIEHSFWNIKKLRLIYETELEKSLIRELLSFMPNLTVLCIDYNIPLTTGLHRELLAQINEIPLLCRNLEHVTLYMENMKNFRWAIQLTKLKCFSFLCNSSEMSEFNDLVRRKKDQLTTLKFHYASFKFNRHILNVITQIRCLKTLHLPAAKYFALDDSDLHALAVLRELVEIKVCGKHKITNSGLLKFVDTCRQLKWVNISYTTIDNEFPILLLPLITSSNRKRISFLAYGTKIEVLPLEYKAKEIQKRAQFICDKPDKDVTKTYGYDNFDDKLEEWTDFFEFYSGL